MRERKAQPQGANPWPHPVHETEMRDARGQREAALINH